MKEVELWWTFLIHFKCWLLYIYFVTLLFFPDFSPATAARRQSFIPVLKKMTALGLQPFLTYPAGINLWHKGEQRSFDSPQKAEDFISSLSQKTTYTVAPQGNGRTAATISSARREGLDGRDGGDSCCREKMVAGWTWIPVESLLFPFLSPPGMLFLFVRRNCHLLVRLTPPPFFSGGD